MPENNNVDQRRIWALTLFPEAFSALTEQGIIARAFKDTQKHHLTFKAVQIRDFCEKNYKGVDDAPYGGGAGMVMRADILYRALLEGVVAAGGYGENFRESLHIIYMDPRGSVWNQKMANQLYNEKFMSETVKDLVFICGRYEGVDERFIHQFVDQQISIGDYILSGGEMAAMVVVDCLMRLVPGVLGNKQGIIEESFEENLLEHPQYTRPAVFRGEEVPAVLLSGDHKKIAAFKLTQKIAMTKRMRPDLLALRGK